MIVIVDRMNNPKRRHRVGKDNEYLG